MSDILEAYSKANKVISSCQSILQIEVARKYISLFFAQFTAATKHKWGGFPIRVADNITISMYEELKKNLKAKEKSLSKLVV